MRVSDVPSVISENGLGLEGCRQLFAPTTPTYVV